MRRSKARVAIVSDAMTQRGGAERVVEVLAELFPDAPIFATLYCPKRGPRTLTSRVRPSFLNALPWSTAHHRWYFPLFPLAVESFDLSGYDIIVSSHHCVAKGVLRNGSQTHVCYCHTPMRALWERSHAELSGLPGPLRWPADVMLFGMRQWDYASAARVDSFIANSSETQRRISKHYGRDSLVIHPPIDVERFTPGTRNDDDYYVVVARSVPYKRIDIAVDAARRLGRRLVVVGGEARETEGTVRFLGHVSDQRLVELMRGARALIAPQHEDFGMAILEANACGRPVIALGRGGALESVINGKTGLLVNAQSVDAFASAISRFEEMSFDGYAIRRHAEHFSKSMFMRAFEDAVYEAHERSQRAEQFSFSRLSVEAGTLMSEVRP